MGIQTISAACRRVAPGIAGLALCSGVLAKPLFHFECIPSGDKVRPDAGYSINSSGVIAGRGSRNYESVCFKYADGVVTELPDSLDSACWFINDRGDIAGTSNLTDSYEHATVWMADGRRLQVLANTNASAINNAGQLAAYTQRETGPHVAYLYTETTRTPLGSFGGGSTLTRGLNDAGVVVGTSLDTVGTWRAFAWQAGAMSEVCQRAGATETEALGVAATGRRLCTAALPTGMVGFLEQADGTQHDLPALDGSYWVPRSMNAHGQVVGGLDEPVYYDGKRAYKLSRLGDAASSDIRITYATFISDSGVILGAGRRQGLGECAVIATPVSH